MIIKQVPKSFIVRELYDIDQLKINKGEGGTYAYFEFTKINLSQQKAIVFLAQKLGINSKRIHYCGSKDKVAVTNQLISIQNCSSLKAQEFEETLNSSSEDMSLTYIGQFNSRLNLSDNLGNSFEIVVEDLSDEEIKAFASKSDTFKVYNFFQTQRFGVCKNTHSIGLLLIQNKIKDALFEVLSSIPLHLQGESKNYLKIVNDVKENFDEFSQEELITYYKEMLECFPVFLRGFESCVKHLINTPKDVSGAFRTIPKKLRTLYVHAFQSAIFNEHVLYIKQQGLDIERICFVGADMQQGCLGYEKNLGILERLGLRVEDLRLKHMPELELRAIEKEVFSQVSEFNCEELDGAKIRVSFSLGVGSYATQVLAEVSGNEEIIVFGRNGKED